MGDLQNGLPALDGGSAVFKDPNAVQLTSNETSSKTDEGTSEETWSPSKHEKAIIYTLAFLNLIVSLDATIIVTCLAAIVNDIGGTTTEAFWIGTSYLLVNAVSMPMICSISDVIGRPICLTFSLAAFTVGTIICCVAQNMTTLLVGRCVQGVGGGGIHALSLVIQTDFIPLRWRPKWYATTLGAWALGLSLGPIMGGAIAENTTWRWVFYLMFPICGLGLVAVPYLLTLRPKKASAQEKLSRIDWIGSLAFTGSTTAFLIAISWGGTQHPWDSAATLAPLIIGFLGIVGTTLYEIFLAKHPFLNKSLFHDISSIATYIAAGAQGILLYGTIYYGPFYFMSVKEYSPMNSGVALLPMLLPFAVFGAVTGRLVTHFNSFRWAIWGGWLVGTVATAMFVAWRINESRPVWIITLLIAGSSHGTILTAQNFASQAMCKDGNEGAAAAMYIFVRQFGMAIGVGIGSTAFQNVMKTQLGNYGLPTEIAENAEAYMPTLHSMPEGQQRDEIFDAYKAGFQAVFAVWLAISVLILFASLIFIKRADMNRKLNSEHQLDSERMTRHWGKRGAKNDV